MSTSTHSVDPTVKILSDITVYMKYARYLPELKRRETWEEIVTRNKDMHKRQYPHLANEIDEAYKYVYNKKVLPSMRSMQFAGRPIEVNNARMYNCSTLPIDHPDAFSETMFLLLSGAGVGYSTQKHHVSKLPIVQGQLPLQGRQRPKRYLIGDSIEGWADAVKVLVESYFYGKKPIEFDFRDIRPKGSDLVTSGGKAPGPQPLRECLTQLTNVFENALQERGRGTRLKPIEVHDMMCHIADAVLAGGIRRAAMISLFSFDDEEMMTAKTGAWWEHSPQRGRANNSAVALRSKITKAEFQRFWGKVQASGSGEPGIFFTNDKDYLTNPCFTGDTIVATADGRNGVPISQLAEESQGQTTVPVYSASPVYRKNKNGNPTSFSHWRWEIKDAVAFETGTKPTVEVTLSDGTSFRCTPDHRLALPNGQYVEATESLGKELNGTQKEGEDVGQRYENPTVVSVVWTGEEEAVYDLTVEDNHNFAILTQGDEGYVNSTGLLVHNCCEISLKPFGVCNLTEIDASKIESQEDFDECARVAAFIGTLQAGYTNFHYLRDVWRETAEEEALLGVSMTGIATGTVFDYDMTQAATVAKEENARVAERISINPAKRITCGKPSGSTSLTLGTSSGVHAWHNDYYIRRIRVGKDEPIYRYLLENHPHLVEDEFFRPETMAVIGVPQAAPEGAILRDESPTDLLERVKQIHHEWIRPGHREGQNTHNQSVTVSIKEDEWETVGEWMWQNRHSYNGISVIPYDGGTYKQAPFEDITKEDFEKMAARLGEIDLTQIREETDQTDLMGEIACGPDGCSVVGSTEAEKTFSFSNVAV